MTLDTAAVLAPGIDWRIADAPVDYQTAVAEMEARVAGIRAGDVPDTVWLLEHPPLYTAGTSAKDADLLEPGRFPVYRTGRGGQFTYHGPGQRVAYVMLDIKARGGDVRGQFLGCSFWNNQGRCAGPSAADQGESRTSGTKVL